MQAMISRLDPFEVVAGVDVSPLLMSSMGRKAPPVLFRYIQDHQIHTPWEALLYSLSGLMEEIDRLRDSPGVSRVQDMNTRARGHLGTKKQEPIPRAAKGDAGMEAREKERVFFAELPEERPNIGVPGGRSQSPKGQDQEQQDCPQTSPPRSTAA